MGWGKKPSAMALKEAADRDASSATTRCLFCPWRFAGTVAEGREAWQAHRALKHPERPARLKRRGQGFVGVKA